jgi:hypothetical protein
MTDFAVHPSPPIQSKAARAYKDSDDSTVRQQVLLRMKTRATGVWPEEGKRKWIQQGYPRVCVSPACPLGEAASASGAEIWWA